MSIEVSFDEHLPPMKTGIILNYSGNPEYVEFHGYTFPVNRWPTPYEIYAKSGPKISTFNRALETPTVVIYTPGVINEIDTADVINMLVNIIGAK